MSCDEFTTEGLPTLRSRRLAQRDRASRSLERRDVEKCAARDRRSKGSGLTVDVVAEFWRNERALSREDLG